MRRGGRQIKGVVASSPPALGRPQFRRLLRPAISRVTRSAPLAPCIWSRSTISAAFAARSAAAARTSAAAWASAKAIFASACLVRRAMKSLHALGGVLGQLLGLGARLGEDRRRVGFRLGALLLEARQQRGRLLAQLCGLVEFRLDRLAARVERLQDRARRAEVDENADEDEKAEKNEDFGVEFHRAASLTARPNLTAAATAAGSAARPPSRSTIAPVASRAISETLVIACARVAAICFSAVGELGGDLVLQRLAPGVRFGCGPIAGGLGQGLGVGARLGERLLMRRRGRVGFLMHRRRVVEVARDAGPAVLDHRPDLRQRALRHVPVEKRERDEEPDDLRRKRARVRRAGSSIGLPPRDRPPFAVFRTEPSWVLRVTKPRESAVKARPPADRNAALHLRLRTTAGTRSAARRPVETILEAQIALVRQGISPGSIDGVFGAQTRSALIAFQKKRGITPSGLLDASTKPLLLISLPAMTDGTVTAEDLARLLPVPKTWLDKSNSRAWTSRTLSNWPGEKGFCHPQLIRALNPNINWNGLAGGTPVTIPQVQYPVVAVKAALVKISLQECVLEAFDEGKPARPFSV